MQKWCRNKENVEKELQKKKDKYSARNSELNEEQLEIKCEIQNEKKETQRYVMITLHLHINHQWKESENIEKIKD